MEVHASAAFTTGRQNAGTTLKGKKGVPQRQYGHYEEEKKYLAARGYGGE
jgi:hypothetical protein